MLPTMMLAAALVPCAVPAPDKETTSQDGVATMNGRWQAVSAKGEPIGFVAEWECSGGKVVYRINGVLHTSGSFRLAPCARGYMLTLSYKGKGPSMLFIEIGRDAFHLVEEDTVWKRIK
jgi:hypothetical protein